MKNQFVSTCGSYVALVFDSTIRLYSNVTESEYYEYSLSDVMNKHKEKCGYNNNADNYNGYINKYSGNYIGHNTSNTCDNNGSNTGYNASSSGYNSLYYNASNAVRAKFLVWEIPVSENCTKFAVGVTDGTLDIVVIFELYQLKPIIIEVDAIGVSHVQWIGGPVPDSGSYVNCVQLAVFLNLSLDVKVYSLLTTNIQFTLAKPFTEIVTHPTKKNIWSILLTPYFDKNLMSRSVLKDEALIRPVLLHFWSDGSTSKLLASLKLNLLPGTESSLQWSPSGKWLRLYDNSSTLSGYRIYVYNFLGLHNKHVKDLTTHAAMPSIKFAPLLPSYLSLGEDLTWIPIWSSDENQEKIFVIAISQDFTLHSKYFDISTMLTINATQINLSATPMWSQSLDLKGKIRYTKLHYYLQKVIGNWKLITSRGNIAVFSSRSLVLVLRLSKTNVEVRFAVAAALAFVDSQIIDENRLIITFEDHIAVGNTSDVSVLTSTDSQFQHLKVRETSNIIDVITLENGTNGPLWNKISNVFGTHFVNITSPKRNSYRKGITSELMGDSKLAEKSYDLTDTFHSQKKRKLQMSISNPRKIA